MISVFGVFQASRKTTASSADVEDTCFNTSGSLSWFVCCYQIHLTTMLNFRHLKTPLLLFLSAVPFWGLLHLSTSSSLHVLFLYIHQSPLWSSSRPPVPVPTSSSSPDIFTIPPLFMSKPSQSGLSDFLSRTSNMCCSSDVLTHQRFDPNLKNRRCKSGNPPSLSGSRNEVGRP